MCGCFVTCTADIYDMCFVSFFSMTSGVAKGIPSLSRAEDSATDAIGAEFVKCCLNFVRNIYCIYIYICVYLYWLVTA